MTITDRIKLLEFYCPEVKVIKVKVNSGVCYSICDRKIGINNILFTIFPDDADLNSRRLSVLLKFILSIRAAEFEVPRVSYLSVDWVIFRVSSVERYQLDFTDLNRIAMHYQYLTISGLWITGESIRAKNYSNSNKDVELLKSALEDTSGLILKYLLKYGEIS